MNHIGILAKPSRELNRLIPLLRESGNWKTHVFTQIHQVIQTLHPTRWEEENQFIDGLILFLDCFADYQSDIVIKFRRLLGSRPLLVYSTKNPPPDLSEAIRETTTAWLDPLRDLGQAEQVLKKLVSGKMIGTRRHIRYRTFQAATIKNSQALTAPAVVLDLAVGGAQVRAFGGEFSKGDKLELFIHLPALNKEHRVSSEVVWTTNESLLEPGQVSSKRLGLRFL